MTEPRVIFAEAMDEKDLQEFSQEEDEFAEDLPVMKTRTLAPELASQVMLTKHFKLQKDFVPVFTGGAFNFISDKKHAFSLNDGKITLFDTDSGDVIGTLALENEEVLTFALSLNSQLLAVSNKTRLLRVYKLPNFED